MELGDRVRAERLNRNLSVRQAAALGGISNTWWGRFEDGKQPLTPAISAAVSAAFGWDQSWAVSLPHAGVGELRAQVADLSDRVVVLEQQLEALTDAVAERASAPRAPVPRSVPQGS